MAAGWMEEPAGGLAPDAVVDCTRFRRASRERGSVGGRGAGAATPVGLMAELLPTGSSSERNPARGERNCPPEAVEVVVDSSEEGASGRRDTRIVSSSSACSASLLVFAAVNRAPYGPPRCTCQSTGNHTQPKPRVECNVPCLDTPRCAHARCTCHLQLKATLTALELAAAAAKEEAMDWFLVGRACANPCKMHGPSTVPLLQRKGWFAYPCE